MVHSDAARNTVEMDYPNGYIIQPEQDWYERQFLEHVPEDFEYRSDTNPDWLKGDALKEFINGV